MDLKSKIEALLFWKAEPLAIKKLAELVEADIDATKIAINELETSLAGRGISIVRSDDEVMLGTAKECGELIEKIAKEERTRDLGKAGLETLSIILYQGPISRADIDYIRGVNSQFILRNLLIRGLVERVENPKDARSFLYKTSLDLLAHLGLSKIEDLPEYDKVRADIESFKQSNQTESAQSESSQSTGGEEPNPTQSDAKIDP